MPKNNELDPKARLEGLRDRAVSQIDTFLKLTDGWRPLREELAEAPLTDEESLYLLLDLIAKVRDRIDSDLKTVLEPGEDAPYKCVESWEVVRVQESLTDRKLRSMLSNLEQDSGWEDANTYDLSPAERMFLEELCSGGCFYCPNGTVSYRHKAYKGRYPLRAEDNAFIQAILATTPGECHKLCYQMMTTSKVPEKHIAAWLNRWIKTHSIRTRVPEDYVSTYRSPVSSGF